MSYFLFVLVAKNKVAAHRQSLAASIAPFPGVGVGDPFSEHLLPESRAETLEGRGDVDRGHRPELRLRTGLWESWPAGSSTPLPLPAKSSGQENGGLAGRIVGRRMGGAFRALV